MSSNIEDTNEKLEAVQKAIDELQSRLSDIKEQLPDINAKKKLDSLREDSTMWVSRAFSSKKS